MVTIAPKKTVTPLMQQYLQIKSRYPNEILFFRLGDFYEMFFEDAVTAAPLLEVALTKRQSTPMCGVPHHAVTGYVAKLLKAGKSVAMAEQLEDPKKTKGMVKRDVVRVITPGTIVEDELLPSKANNFLVALSMKKSGGDQWALAAADVSTGRLWIGDYKNDFHWNQLKAQLACLNPSEILLVGDGTPKLAQDLSFEGVIRHWPTTPGALNFCDQVKSALQNYLKKHQANEFDFQSTEPLPMEAYGAMFLDESAIRHLELVESSDPSRQGLSLLKILDQTVTPLGSRLLRWWVLHPSLNKQEIENRLNQVQCFVEEQPSRDHLNQQLKEVSDIERIVVRTRAGSASPRDLASLRQSMETLPTLRQSLESLINREVGGDV